MSVMLDPTTVKRDITIINKIEILFKILVPQLVKIPFGTTG